MYMYIYTHIYIYVYLHTYLQKYIHVHTHMKTNMNNKKRSIFITKRSDESGILKGKQQVDK